MSFANPTPSFPAENENNEGSGIGGVLLDDENNNIDFENEHGHINITAFIACKLFNVSLSESEISANGTTSLDDFHRNYPPRHRSDNSPSTSYAGGDWEGNQDGWTLGGSLRQSAIAGNFGDDGGGAFGSNYCSRDWDDILCWPETAVGEVATLPCFKSLHGITYNASGFAKRMCMEGGIWNRTEYSGCKPFTSLPNITTDTGSLDITTGVYLFGYCLSLIALIAAASIFISFKELRCLRNTIHSHLMVTYILADACWVLSVVTTDQARTVQHSSKATCFTFILFHYLHLTNFFWMFVEGVCVVLPHWWAIVALKGRTA